MAYSYQRYPLGLNPLETALLTPGPLGHNDAASPDVSNSRLGDTPGPLGVHDHADPEVAMKVQNESISRGSDLGCWNPEAAASFLADPGNGWAGSKSQGRCARAVRQAINAGHIATPSNPVAAADYVAYLPTLGFFAVELTEYIPEVGDIAVFPAIPEVRLSYGHIEMYTGYGWQSDYIQPPRPLDGRYGDGFFANRMWSTRPFTIFRKRGSK